MSENTIPSPPNETKPDVGWEHYELYVSVIRALYSLPSRFESTLNINGVFATDLFAFNSSLGATIEQQAVDLQGFLTNLNRCLWEPLYAIT